MLRVMFLCTGNSCRSQMAEGLARDMGAGLFEAHSAGLKPAGINPRAIQVLEEIGIDISGQSSQAIDPELLGQMDLVITLCGHAEEACPLTPPQVERRHWPVDDPARAPGGEAEALPVFRRARDEIKTRVATLVQELLAASAERAGEKEGLE